MQHLYESVVTGYRLPITDEPGEGVFNSATVLPRDGNFGATPSFHRRLVQLGLNFLARPGRLFLAIGP